MRKQKQKQKQNQKQKQGQKSSRKKVDKEFHQAISSREFENATAALKAGAGIDVWVDHSTALVTAIKANDIAAVTFLLAEGASLSVPARAEFPLMAAIVACAKHAIPDAMKRTRNEVLSLPFDLAIIDLLLHHGADIEQFDENNRASIGTALVHMPYHYDLHEKLVSKKTVNTDDFAHFQPLHIAIQKDLSQSTELLLQYGAKLKEGRLLDLAAAHGAKDVFEKLLRQECPTDEDGKRALFEAISKGGSLEILSLAVESFAITTVKDLLEYVQLVSLETYRFGQSLGPIRELHLSRILFAALNKSNVDAEFVEVLIEDGADIFAVDGAGRNAIYLCALHSHVALLRAFLEKGVPIEDALFACRQDFHVATAELLLEFGADATLKNSFSQTFDVAFKEELWNMKSASKEDPMIRRQLRRSVDNAEAFLDWFEAYLT